MPTGKPLDGISKEETYAAQEHYTFRVLGQSSTSRGEPVELPAGIVWRLHYLGRAFDCQTIRQLTPGMLRFDYFQTMRLIGELELIARHVTEPLALRAATSIEALLKAARSDTTAALIVERVPRAARSDPP